MTRALLVLAAIACAGALQAEDVKWDDLCGKAKDRTITVKLDAGDSVQGTCVRQRGDEIVISTHDGEMIEHRDRIASVRQENVHAFCTPRDAVVAPIGIALMVTQSAGGWVLIPLTIPVGIAVSGAMVPVCGVASLIHIFAGSRELTII